jgi:hypothetical protein
MPSFTPVSGVYTAATGAQPIAGVASGFSGPFLTETQVLTIYYSRVPVLGNAATSFVGVSSLSSTNTRTSVVEKTALNIVVEAVWKKVKDYNTYSTSSYTQMQRLGIQPYPDFYGSYYGAASALTLSGVLGPVGSVVTTQPYINRRPWVEGTDSEVSGVLNGANCAFFNLIPSSGSYTGYVANWEGPFSQSNIYNWVMPAIPASKANTFLANSDTHIARGYGVDFVLPGPYATSQENGNTFASLIQSICNKISLVPGTQSQTMNGFISLTPTPNTAANPVTATPFLTSADYVGLPQFNGNFIDLT